MSKSRFPHAVAAVVFALTLGWGLAPASAGGRLTPRGMAKRVAAYLVELAEKENVAPKDREAWLKGIVESDWRQLGTWLRGPAKGPNQGRFSAHLTEEYYTVGGAKNSQMKSRFVITVSDPKQRQVGESNLYHLDAATLKVVATPRPIDNARRYAPLRREVERRRSEKAHQKWKKEQRASPPRDSGRYRWPSRMTGA